MSWIESTSFNWDRVRVDVFEMPCPHCGKDQLARLGFQGVAASRTSSRTWISHPGDFSEDGIADQIIYMRCGSCRRIGIWTQQVKCDIDDDHPPYPVERAGEWKLVWPHHGHLPSSLDALPARLNKLAKEAFVVSGDSATAAVLLARRFVDDFLVDILGANEGDSLEVKIAAIKSSNEVSLPHKLVARLDAVRNVGNSGAHRRIDDQGAHVEITDEDARTLLAIIDYLAHWYEGDVQLDEGVDGVQKRFAPWWRPHR